MTAELSHSEIKDLVARGLESSRSGYTALADPQGAERLAVELAHRCEGHRPSCLLVWQRPHDLVLAHGMARVLGTPVVRAYDSEGLVGIEGAFSGNGGRVLLVGDAFSSAEVVRALYATAEQEGHVVVAAAALREPDESARAQLREHGIPLVVLLTALGRTGAPNG